MYSRLYNVFSRACGGVCETLPVLKTSPTDKFSQSNSHAPTNREETTYVAITVDQMLCQDEDTDWDDCLEGPADQKIHPLSQDEEIQVVQACPIQGNNNSRPTQADDILATGKCSSEHSRSLPIEDNDIQWNILLDDLAGTGWKPIPADSSYCSQYRVIIKTQFDLESRLHFSYVRDYGSDLTIARCLDGVYAFGLEFDFCFLVARTNRGSLKWMKNPSSPPQGPTRPAGSPYDVNADEVFPGYGSEYASDAE